MDTHSSMAAAAALYKQLSTLAGFVSQSSVTRTGQPRRKKKETWTDRPVQSRSNRSPGTNWNGHSVVTEEWASKGE